MQQQTLLFPNESDSGFDQLDPKQQHILLALMASLIVDVFNAEAQSIQEEYTDE